ncbi:molybdenum cofactor guanylyltransferase [Gordonia phthalatica]|uniref:Molybdopterin-guanine dinucleotide biosynthesis protein n=1 Tax=Gordonia phthalatica TaxID=1136941 RepID=A0A0N7FUY4_9ACTN|nr:molybdenum cofactor guanylyltransferase [Gordonia phthalatica]ALG85647.1 molybdopterin-guanine dinucleotide biosynthesis protein [Gordonia phthalatica]
MTAAIILAGGRASRLDGADKAAVEIGGRPLIDAAFAAVSGASPVIAVGPESVTRNGVTVVREDPPFGGPVAGIHAALGHLDTVGAPTETWLLACDLPRAELIVAQLHDVPIPEDADGVVLVDADGREQWLAGRYRVASLRASLDGLPDVRDVAVRRLLAPLNLHTVTDRIGATLDLDTWADVNSYRNQEDPV